MSDEPTESEAGVESTESEDRGQSAEGTVPEDLRRRIAADPFCETLGVELRELTPGRAVTALEVTDDLLNFHGTPHGGAIYSLADAAFAAASNSHGEAAVALETNVSYLEAVHVGTTLTATAAETHRTRRTAEYEVVVTTEADAEAGGEGTNGSADRVATFRGRVYRP